MSKFTSSIATTIATCVLSTIALVNIGSLVTTENVVTPNMNVVQKAMVATKNINLMGYHTVKTVVTNNESDFLTAFLSGWVSLPILASEAFIATIAVAILASQAAKINEK